MFLPAKIYHDAQNLFEHDLEVGAQVGRSDRYTNQRK